MNGSNNAKFAGDISNLNYGCSRGVDCSGFVSNAWNLGSKYGTCALESISTQITSTDELQKGDIMNRCSITPRHTIIFGYFYGDGMMGYEATSYLQYDRVVRIYRSFASINTYSPRRYKNVCSELLLPLVRGDEVINPYP